MIDKKLVAETWIYAIDKDKREFEIRAMVGMPYKRESGDWACPIALDGLHERLPDINGVDSWQSLVLALNLIYTLLECFAVDGGELYREKGGDEVSVAELYVDVKEVLVPDSPPTEKQQARIDKLTADHLRKINEAILANASTQWRKVARVVGDAMTANSGIVPRVPDIFYAERVGDLVAAGKLESQGNLAAMRFSEVRLPQNENVPGE